MLPWLAPYRRPLAAGAVAVLFTNLFAALGPWILRGGIDSLQGIGERPLAHWALALVAAAAVDGVFRFVARRTLIGVSRRVEYDLRGHLYARLQRLPLGFFDRREVGDLMARVTNDLNAVRMFLGPGLMYTANTALILGFSLALMLRISPPLTLWALAPLPLVTLSIILVMRHVHERASRVQEGFATLTTRVRESLEGIRVVKAFAREDGQARVFEAASEDYLERNMALARVQRLFVPAMTLFTGVGVAFVLGRGGLLVMAGDLTLGAFVAFTGYLVLLMWPMAALGWTINLFQRGRAAWTRLEELLDEPEEPFALPGRTPPGAGALLLEGVRFSRGGREILRGVDLKVAAGSTVALVGPTGAGKTTLVRLLARLHEPDAGRILLDGAPLAEWDLAALRASLAFVPQEAFLFSDTIARNVEVGRPGVPEDEIGAAAALAHLAPEIAELEDGLGSVVGERGVTLSGGQRQRATLARALVRRPRVLVLDDAFSAMDTATEEAILGKLGDALDGTTVLLVSHRLSTIRRADRVVYLEEGRVREDGTHEELLARGGRYAGYIRRQRLLEELERRPGRGEAA